MSILEDKLSPFIEGAQTALNYKNYYASLSLSLTLPDICSKLEYPKKQGKERYKEWFNNYMSNNFIDEAELKEQRLLLNGEDFYALRCAFLHEGSDYTTNQKARENLEKFDFHEPGGVGTLSIMYTDYTNEVIQVPIDGFCREIIDGVYKWVQVKRNDENINKRADTLMKISKYNDKKY